MATQHSESLSSNIHSMIVITGPGRSGTSIMAQLYIEMGFRAHGEMSWSDSIRAGFEARDVVDLNRAILKELGATDLAPRGSALIQKAAAAVAKVGRRVRRISGPYSPLRIETRLNDMAARLEYARRRFNGVRWDHIEQIAQTYGAQIKATSERHELVKDPRFTWTLPVWLRAGASIDAVIVCVRDIATMVQSRIDAGMIPKAARISASDNFVYGIGILLTTLVLHDIDFVVLPFPRYLDDAAELYRKLPARAKSDYASFARAFRATVQPGLIHYGQPH